MPHDDSDFSRRMDRVEGLVRQVEAFADPGARETARELVRCLMDLHAGALGGMLATMRESGVHGQALLNRFAADGLVSSVLLLHDLHPEPVEARVRKALADVQRRHVSQSLELVAVTDGVVRLRWGLETSPASQAVRPAVERAIYAAAPDVLAVEFEEAVQGQSRHPLPLLSPRPLTPASS